MQCPRNISFSTGNQSVAVGNLSSSLIVRSVEGRLGKSQRGGREIPFAFRAAKITFSLPPMAREKGGKEREGILHSIYLRWEEVTFDRGSEKTIICGCGEKWKKVLIIFFGIRMPKHVLCGRMPPGKNRRGMSPRPLPVLSAIRLIRMCIAIRGCGETLPPPPPIT